MFKTFGLIAEAVIIIILTTLLFSEGCKRKKSDAENSQLKVQLYACLHAPVKITDSTKPVTVKDTNKIHPKPVSQHVKKDTNHQISPVHGDSIPCPDPEDSYYKDTYKKGDSITISYSAQVWGEIDWLRFDGITYPSYKIYIDRLVPCFCDTNKILKKANKIRNELWIYGKPGIAISPLRITDATLGIQWQVQRKWGLGVGVGYDWVIDTPKVEGMVLFNIR